MSGRAARLIYLKNGCERNPQLIIFWSYFWFKRRCKGVITHIKGSLGCRIHTPFYSCSASLETKPLAWKALEMTFLCHPRMFQLLKVGLSTEFSLPQIQEDWNMWEKRREVKGKRWRNWGFRKLTVSSLWRFSIKLHVLITRAFILVVICTNRNWFWDIF